MIVDFPREVKQLSTELLVCQVVTLGCAACSAYIDPRSTGIKVLGVMAGVLVGAVRDVQLRACYENTVFPDLGRVAYQRQTIHDILRSQVVTLVLTPFTQFGPSLWLGYSAGSLGARLWKNVSDWAVS